MNLKTKLALIGLVTFVFSPISYARANSSSVVISEIQTGSKTSSYEEFVELTNITDQEINLTGWRIEYASSSENSKWIKKVMLIGVIEPNGRYLSATKDYLVDKADVSFSSGFSDSAGSIRLVKVETDSLVEEEMDVVGWGNVNYMEGESAPAPEKGYSLKRKTDDEGRFVDTQNNKNDFFVSTSPSPSSDDQPVTEEEEKEQEVVVADTEIILENEENSSIQEDYEDIWITELMPDPVSPQTDADDEFIEIYNSGISSIDLFGYVLQTGITYNHSYILPTMQIAPGQYIVLPSSQTKLSLSNSGGRSRIVGPSGKVIFETPAYDKAEPGQSFIRLENGSWEWTQSPTPSAPNQLTVKQTESTSTSSKSSSSSSKKKSSKSSKPKVKKASSSKKVSKPKVESTSSSPANNPSDTSSPKLNNKWVVALGASAILYGAYEYRDDVRNKFIKLRRNNKSS